MATEHRHSWTRFWVTNSVGHGCICHARWDFGDPQSRTFGHAARGCSSGSKSFPPFVLWWIHILHCSAKLPKKLQSTVRHGFFWKLWQEIMHWSCLSRLICRSWFCHYSSQTASMVHWIEQSWYSACKTHANTLCSSTTCSGVSSVGTLSPLKVRAVEEILGGVKSPLMQQWMCFSSQACRSPFSASGVYDKFIREVFWRREARTSCGDQRGSYGGAEAFPEQTYKIFYNSGVYHC